MRTRAFPSPRPSSRRRSASSQTTSKCGLGYACAIRHQTPKQPLTRGLRRVQNNFGRPVEWALVKDYAWSTPQLRKLDVPVSSSY